MPRISRADALESKIIAEAEEKAFDETLPTYLKVRYLSVLGNMLRRRDSRLEAKAAAAAKRKAAKPVSYPSVLPENGRRIVGFVPAAADPCAGWPELKAD